MSENRELEYHGNNKSAVPATSTAVSGSSKDEEKDIPLYSISSTADKSDIIYSKRLRGGRHPINLNVSSEINQRLKRKETWKCKTEVTKTPSVQLASSHVDIIDTINIIDTIDRPGKTKKEGCYARSGKYAYCKNEPGKRIPKAGAYAEAGVGRARAELSVLEAEAKGPNASAGAEASVGMLGAAAMARAEAGSVSAKAGPVGLKLGLGVDTGVSVGLTGIEAKVLGTGITVGRKTSVSLLGSEVACSVM
ncbi:uncharacterized protein LOC127444626 [Myxocyprinus asiaticus]|uniref:uncharacterized protein LOC127444626 n=1 Tax=Myxocyprinus asiaticus TaxID=70543 RepID=UPI002222F700|nr:uncharacterized protein LOC127444626 [Myxocyprinus asiaticus]